MVGDVHAAGIHTRVKDGRPIVSCVILRQDGGAWVEHGKWEHVCDQQEEFPQQLLNLADALPHLLDAVDLKAVVLRDRDHSPGAKIADLKQDFGADGVVLAYVRRRCATVQVLPGSRIGELCGSNKASAESDAKSRHGKGFAESGAAARAAAALV